MRMLGGLLACAGASVLAAGAVMAQVPTPVPAYPGNALGPEAVGPEGQTVINRPRPDYDPLGVRAGSFLVYPSLGVSETFDSNIFATPSGDKSDFYTTESPGLSVNSDWNRHALNFSTNGQFKQYMTHTTENVNNGSVDMNGRYDISNGEYLIADGGYALLHEDRASPDAFANAKNPVQYTTTGGYLAYVYALRRIGFRIDSTITSYAYNNQSTLTGLLIPESDRDRIEYVVAPRVSYEFIPGYSAFVRVLGNVRQYNQQDQFELATFGVSARRNSHGGEVDAGATIELTRIITAELYVGYLDQIYEARSLYPNISGPAGGGNLLWNITPSTSLRGSLSQSVAETDLIGTSGSNETNFTLTAEQELLRNLLASASLGYVRDDYVGISRLDNTYGADIGIRYLMNRNIRLTSDISYSSRSSSVGQNYDRVIASVGARLGF